MTPARRSQLRQRGGGGGAEGREGSLEGPGFAGLVK